MSNVNSWGGEHFKITGLNFKDVSDFSLESAVKLLPARVKQAFYAAAQRKGVLKRSTWNGCAFNAGAQEVEFVSNNVEANSLANAAIAFKTTQAIVKRFINAWDGSKDRWNTDAEATKALVGMLEETGLFSEPDRPQVRTVSITVYESTITDAELTEQLVSAPMDSFDEDFQKVMAEVEMLMELEPVQ